MITAEAIRKQDTESLERTGGPVVNVGDAERLASKIGGGLLVGLGLMRGGVRGLALSGLGGALLYRGSTGHCPAYHALGASTSDDHGAASSVPAQAGVHVVESITIDRPAAELFRFWRDYKNLPRFMKDVESVQATDPSGTKSHWVVKGPMGTKLEWDAEIHNETPGELIAWRSTGGQVDTAGSVRFVAAPGGRGTEVQVNQKMNPPGGKLGVTVAKLFGQDPSAATRENLRLLKNLMEAGEIPTITGQPKGAGAGRQG